MAGGLRYGVEVRAAQPADAGEIARLLALGGKAVAVPELAARLEAIRADPAAAVLVATGYPGLCGIVVLGWVPLLQSPRPIARITTLIVDMEERRRGIGRLLLKAASQVARLAGCDALDAAVSSDQDAAAAFCRATGFTCRGCVQTRSLRRRS